MVGPKLEYTSDVWDPYHVEHIVELEKVQQRAVCWVLNDYGRCSLVTSMLEQLSWPTLQFRHKSSRLQTLHIALYHQISLMIPPYFLQTLYSRQYHLLHCILPKPSTTEYQYSYFYRTLNDWNKLLNSQILTLLKMNFKHYCNCMYVNLSTPAGLTAQQSK